MQMLNAFGHEFPLHPTDWQTSAPSSPFCLPICRWNVGSDRIVLLRARGLSVRITVCLFVWLKQPVLNAWPRHCHQWTCCAYFPYRERRHQQLPVANKWSKLGGKDVFIVGCISFIRFSVAHFMWNVANDCICSPYCKLLITCYLCQGSNCYMFYMLRQQWNVYRPVFNWYEQTEWIGPVKEPWFQWMRALRSHVH